MDVYIFPPGESKPCNSMNKLIREKHLTFDGVIISEEMVANMWTAAKGACGGGAIQSVLLL